MASIETPYPRRECEEQGCICGANSWRLVRIGSRILGICRECGSERSYKVMR